MGAHDSYRQAELLADRRGDRKASLRLRVERFQRIWSAVVQNEAAEDERKARVRGQLDAARRDWKRGR